MPRKKKHKTGKTPPAAGAGGGVGKAGAAAKGPGVGATFCAQCNVTFTRPSNLKKHNLIKHTKVSYLFSIYEFSFNANQNKNDILRMKMIDII